MNFIVTIITEDDVSCYHALLYVSILNTCLASINIKEIRASNQEYYYIVTKNRITYERPAILFATVT